MTYCRECLSLYQACQVAREYLASSPDSSEAKEFVERELDKRMEEYFKRVLKVDKGGSVYTKLSNKPD